MKNSDTRTHHLAEKMEPYIAFAQNQDNISESLLKASVPENHIPKAHPKNSNNTGLPSHVAAPKVKTPEATPSDKPHKHEPVPFRAQPKEKVTEKKGSKNRKPSSNSRGKSPGKKVGAITTTQNMNKQITTGIMPHKRPPGRVTLAGRPINRNGLIKPKMMMKATGMKGDGGNLYVAINGVTSQNPIHKPTTPATAPPKGPKNRKWEQCPRRPPLPGHGNTEHATKSKGKGKR